MIRDTCRTCEENGVTTQLIQIDHWGCCPIHDAVWIEGQKRRARALLGIPKLELLDRGIPSRS